MSLPGIEPGTLSVLDSRDNHYTTETTTFASAYLYVYNIMYIHIIISQWSHTLKDFTVQ